MHFSRVMKENIDGLLKKQGLRRHDLAQWCKRGDDWISHIMNTPSRGFPVDYWPKIADFLGVEVFHLLQPGATPLTERRSGTDRRQGIERRVGPAQRLRERDREPIAPLTADEHELIARMRALPSAAMQQLRSFVITGSKIVEHATEPRTETNAPKRARKTVAR